MLRPNALRYCQEQFETTLPKSGLTRPEQAAFLKNITAVYKQLPEFTPAFQDKLFDLARSARILSRREEKTPDEMLREIVKNPALIFEVNGIFVPGQPQEKSAGKNPTDVKDIDGVAARAKTPRQKRPYKSRSEHIPLPSDEYLALAALAVHEKAGRLPVINDSRRELGSDSLLGWNAILNRLQAEGRSIKQIVDAYQGKDILPRPLPDAPPAPLPEKSKEQKNDLRKKPVSLSDIALSAIAMFDATGKRPASTSGLIQHGPLADGKSQWGALNLAFREGLRGLKDCGYDTLPAFMEQCFPQTQDNKSRKQSITLSDVALSAIETLDATGKKPNRRSGKILYGPLSQRDISWLAIDEYFRRGVQGMQDCGYKTLSAFMDQCLPNEWSLSDIALSAIATFDTTGKRPMQTSGLIEYGPLADHKIFWRTIDTDFYRGSHGLENCGYDSLSDFIEQCGLFHLLSLSDIALSAIATFDATGKRPSQKTGLISHGPLAEENIRWQHIDTYFVRGSRGLKDCGYDSLAHFMDQCLPNPPKKTRDEVALRDEVPPTCLKDHFTGTGTGEKRPAGQQSETVKIETESPPQAEPTFLQTIFTDSAKIISSTSTLPKSEDIVAGHTVRELGKMLREGKIDGAAEFAHPENPPAATLTHLLIDAGLAVYEGRKIIPAPPESVDVFIASLG